MSKGVDFSSILNKRVEDIESPKPLPPGTYRGIIASVPTEGRPFNRKNEDGSTTEVPTLEVPIAIQEPTAGVDEDLLAKAGLRRRDGKPREVSMRYFVEEESLYKLKTLIKSCGVEAETLGEGLKSLAGAEVLVDLAVQIDQKDPEQQYQRVQRVVGTAG